MSSTFIRLTDYCIVEYIPTPVTAFPGDKILTTEFFKLDNTYTNTRQIYNTDAANPITKNSRDLTVVSVGGAKSIYLDPTLVPIYSDYDTNLTQALVDSGLSANLVFESVKIHFASGFNFTEVRNVIFGIKHRLNNGTELIMSNVVLDAQTAQDIFTYSLRPLFIGNTIYDKTIEILVPAIAHLIDDFETFGAASFAHAITDGIGFSKTISPKVFIGEAAYEEYNAPNNITYDRYQTNLYYDAPVSQNSKFEPLGCQIAEATNGDYIEFFATWDGAFPEDIIAQLNSTGPDQEWIIIHQLQVYEHIGGDTLLSSNQVVYQENNFDEPLYFRPILRNAGFAFAMSIDYTIRLLNRRGPEQVIKTGSLSIFNPNKYGLNLLKLNLPDGPKSMKVYNKIIQKNYEIGSIFSPRSSQVGVPPAPAAQAGTSQIVVQQVLVPQTTVIKQSNIRLTQRNALVQNSDEAAELVYGQGRLTIPIDPTDNEIKFIVYQANPMDPTKQNRVSLPSSSEFKLVFGKTTDFVFPQTIDPNKTNPSQGELCFLVPKELAKRIATTTDTGFHISIVSKLTGSETMLYSGTWAPSEKYAEVLAAEEDALAVVANEALVAQLQQSVALLTAQNEDLTEELNTLKANPGNQGGGSQGTSGAAPVVVGNINAALAVENPPDTTFTMTE